MCLCLPGSPVKRSHFLHKNSADYRELNYRTWGNLSYLYFTHTRSILVNAILANQGYTDYWSREDVAIIKPSITMMRGSTAWQ